MTDLAASQSAAVRQRYHAQSMHSSTSSPLAQASPCGCSSGTPKGSEGEATLNGERRTVLSASTIKANSPSSPSSASPQAVSLYHQSSPSQPRPGLQQRHSAKEQTNLAVRSSCNHCRSKKVRCDKVPAENGGCGRCRREGIECRYDVRDPIGRPRKRKVDEEVSPQSFSSAGTGEHPRQAKMKPDMPAQKRRDSLMSVHTPQQQISYPHGQIDSPYTKASPSSRIDAHSANWNFAFVPVTGSALNGDRQESSAQRLRSPTSASQSMSSSQFSSQTMTPASSTATAALYDTASTVRPNEDAPTLSDLGLAAFLESLDTLEINTEDGLTPTMLEALANPSAALNPSTLNASLSANALPQGLATGSLAGSASSEQSSLLSALSLANMQGSTSYAVPADLSWADPSWLDRISTTPPSAPSAQPAVPSYHRSEQPHPGAYAAPSWPRGPEAGMGQAELRSLDGRLIQPAPAASSCCSKKDGGNGTVATEQPVKREPNAGPCLRTGSAICCCGDSSAAGFEAPAPSPAARHPASPSVPREELRVHCVPDPSGRGCTCLCDVSVALINVRATLRQQARNDSFDVGKDDQSSALHSDVAEATSAASMTTTKRAASTLQLTLSASQAVAAQCACSASCPTCRSDPSTSLSASLLVSTALQIYVRAVRTLRQGFGAPSPMSDGRRTATPLSSHNAIHATGSEWDVSIGQYKPKATNARRIALFAMKLELRDLRDAIAKVSRAASGSPPQSGGPAASSAKKSGSGSFSAPSAAVDENGVAVANGVPGASTSIVDGGVNPIDQVVIRKLHQQLGDLLRTVEGIEEQQDAERNAQSVEAGLL